MVNLSCCLDTEFPTHLAAKMLSGLLIKLQIVLLHGWYAPLPKPRMDQGVLETYSRIPNRNCRKKNQRQRGETDV